MTKQIIIDGVDVSGCDFHSISRYCAIGCQQKNYEGLDKKCRMFEICEENSKCYYKQLQKLKSELKHFASELKRRNQDFENVLKHILEICRCLQGECEEYVRIEDLTRIINEALGYKDE